MKPKKNRLTFIVIVGFALIAITAISRWLAPHEIIPWRADFAAAQHESATTHKPVLVYFTADWCGPCQSLKRTLWADPKIEAVLRDYVPVKVDIDQHPDLAKKYQTDAIPHFVVLDKEGKAVKSTEAAMPSDVFLAWLKGNAE